jgi:hypothetical protein
LERVKRERIVGLGFEEKGKTGGVFGKNAIFFPPSPLRIRTENRGARPRRASVRRPGGVLPGSMAAGDRGKRRRRTRAFHTRAHLGLKGTVEAAPRKSRGRRRCYWWRRGGAWGAGSGRLDLGVVRRGGGGAVLK